VSTAPHRVLFVCLGNICRSPTAEGLMRRLVADAGLDGAVVVDSAGTAGWHIGDPPDRRSQHEAAARGVDISGLRGRQVGAHDFEQFELVLAMDADNQRDLLALAPTADAEARVRLLREFDPDAVAAGDLEVGDPYYGGPEGFERVFDQIESACRGLLDHLTRG
jgi:protein-tyrosine phosphatase